jgi:biopolymer transport protein ExbB
MRQPIRMPIIFSAVALLLTGLCFAFLASAKVPTFQQAFAREAAELRAVKAALQKTKAALDERSADQRQRIESQIDQAQLAVDALRKRERALQRELDVLSAQQETSSDHGVLLDAVLDIAVKRMAVQDSAFSEGSDHIETFSRAVEAAAKGLESSGKIVVKDGPFFRADGKEVSGQIVHIGDIAALGVSTDEGGVLQRLNDGGYRLVDASARATATRFLKGELRGSVPVFLFSRDTKGQGAPKKKGLFEIADAGGPVAWVILGLAALGLLLIAERVWTLSRCTNWRAGRFDALAAKLRQDDFDAASAIAAQMGLVGMAVRSVIADRRLSREEIEKRAGEQVLKALPKIERSLTVLSVITAIAPLLGLLGTVTGMISTFDVITEHGTGDPKLLSGGISEALITTELGLAVAVPFLLLRSLLARWADRIVENMQTHALAAVNILTQERSNDAD